MGNGTITDDDNRVISKSQDVCMYNMMFWFTHMGASRFHPRHTKYVQLSCVANHTAKQMLRPIMINEFNSDLHHQLVDKLTPGHTGTSVCKYS